MPIQNTVREDSLSLFTALHEYKIYWLGNIQGAIFWLWRFSNKKKVKDEEKEEKIVFIQDDCSEGKNNWTLKEILSVLIFKEQYCNYDVLAITKMYWMKMKKKYSYTRWLLRIVSARVKEKITWHIKEILSILLIKK